MTEDEEDIEDTEDIDSSFTDGMKEAKESKVEDLRQGEHPFENLNEEAAEELESRSWTTFFEPEFSEKYEGEPFEEEAHRIRTHLRALWDVLDIESKKDLQNYCKTFETLEEENQAEWEIARNIDALSQKEITKFERLIHERTDIVEDYPGKMKQSDIRNAIRQKASNNSEKEGTELDSVKKESDVTEILEVNDKEIELNPSTEFEVEELKQEILDISRNESGLIRKDKVLNLYEIKLGEGSEQDELHLVTLPDRKLPVGKYWGPIRFLHKDEDRETLQELYQGLSVDEDFEKFAYAAEGNYLMLADSISEESKEQIKNFSNEELREIVYKYLDDGHDYDPKIKKVLYPLRVQHKREDVEPDEVVRRAPHLILLTNSSVGKTFIARKVGVRRDSASLKGLIGFASADKVQEGELDQAIRSQLIDEFTRDKNSSDTGSGLLSIMEIGIYNNTQAGVNLQTELYAPISFMTNPEKDREELSEDEESDFSIYLEAFNESIRDLGGNFAALGSRFGVVLFDENLDPAEGSSLHRDKRRKLQSLVDWMMEEIAPQYSKLEEECEWIDEPFDQAYQEQIEQLSKSISFEPEFQSFWKSHLEAYRHTKGLALRAAALEHLSDLLNDSYSVEEITETAKKHLEQFKQINRESLLAMVDTTSVEDAKERKRKLMKSEDAYVEYFLRSVISFYSSREDVDLTDRQPIDLLKDEWQEIKEDIDTLDKDSRYWRFSKLSEQIEKNWSQIKSVVKKKYGVRLAVFNDQHLFSISNEDKFGLLLEGDSPLESKESESSMSSVSSEQKIFETSPSDHLLEAILEEIPEEGMYEQELLEILDHSEEDVSEALNWLESENLVNQKNGKLKSQDVDLQLVISEKD
ncbi:MAG: hypothetical protein ABEK04_02200 [Candidatus Nanohalobium sp.]